MPIKFAYYERYSREIGVLNDLRIILATILLLVVGWLPSWLGINSELPAQPPLGGNEVEHQSVLTRHSMMDTGLAKGS